MSRKKLLLIIFLTMSISTLTGCWDRKELESRAFVMVTGIDKYDPEKANTSDKHKADENENNRFKVSYNLPTFTTIKEGITGKDSRVMLTSVGRTPYETTREITLRGDSLPFFQHMKAVVLGVDVVKNKDWFLETLDGLERQDEISRKLHMFIAEDQASDILEVESELKPLWYKLQGMSEANLSTYAFIPKTLEEVISETVQGSTLIPRITASKTEIKVAGSAVIKKAKFVGWLGEKETKAAAFIRGEAKRDIIQFTHDDVTIPYIIKKLKVKKSAKVEDGKIVVDVTVLTRGNIQQYKVNKFPRMTDVDLLKELELAAEKRIKDKLDTTVNKLQNEMNADVINISEYLEGHHPDIWDQVKDDWDEVFPKVKINIKVKSNIDKIGAVK